MKFAISLAALVGFFAFGSDGFAKGSAAKCANKVIRAARDRAEILVQPQFPLHYIGAFTFDPYHYRVMFREFMHDIDVNVTVGNSCRILEVIVLPWNNS